MIRRIIRIVRRKLFFNKCSFDTKKEYILSKDYNKLYGKVAVVTGGSGHIGRAIVSKLAVEGAIVYVCGTNINNIQAVVDEVLSLGGVAHSCVINVMDSLEIERAFNNIIAKEEKIDILVNCAGGGSRSEAKEIAEQEVSVIDNILNSNLRGSILCVRAVASKMKLQKWGRIIDIGSAVATGGLPKYSEYAAAKAGCIAFVRSVAMELGRYGVTVNCVSPGIVQRGEITEEIFQNIRKTNWLDSYGTAEDISEMVAYLCSEKARFITGQNLLVDGGRTLGLKNN